MGTEIAKITDGYQNVKICYRQMTAWWDNRFCWRSTTQCIHDRRGKEGRNALGEKKKPNFEKMVAVIQ
jgi:hypothetical protein